MGPRFSDEEDEVLVEEVGKHPSLWQPSDPHYKYQILKDNIWTEVSDKVGKPVSDCKKRWKNIKDTYDRKRIRKAGSAPQLIRQGKKWILEEKLSFLQSVKEHRGSFSGVNEEEDKIFDDPEAEMNESPSADNRSLWQNSKHLAPTIFSDSIKPPMQTSFQKSSSHTQKATGSTWRRTDKRRKIVTHLDGKMAERNELINNLLSVEESVDEIDLFFQSIAISVKKLPRHLQHCAKLETLTMIGKLEMELLNSFQPAPSPSPTSTSFSANGSTENNVNFPS